MLCLRDVSGLPLDVDFELDKVIYDELNLTCTEAKYVPLPEMLHSLLNKALKYPERVYQRHKNVKRTDTQTSASGFGYDLYYLPAGLLGIEYLKTHVFRSSKKGGAEAVVEVLSGTLTVYLQRDEEQSDPYSFSSIAAETKVVEVKTGQKLAVPAGYFYTFINATEEAVIFGLVGGEEKIIDPQKLVRSNGMAYYLISKNAKCEIVNNPRYQRKKDIAFVNNAEVNAAAAYQASEVPLYVDYVNNSSKYLQLLG